VFAISFMIYLLLERNMMRISGVLLANPLKGKFVKPALLAKALLPSDKTWCNVCHRVIEKKYWDGHLQSRIHLHGRRKMRNLKQLSLSMWESHRGAPANESNLESEAEIAREFDQFKKTQIAREQRGRGY
jgi:hypothetical protein